MDASPNDRNSTKLISLLQEIGVNFEVAEGDQRDDGSRQIEIEILDEQGTGHGVSLYFDIAADGTEQFVCQE